MYKIGDVVVVRDDIMVNEVYENDWGARRDAMFVRAMQKYMGRQFEIEDITNEYYRLRGAKDDTGYQWFWTDGMIAGLAEPAYFESDFDVFTCDIVSELMRCDNE